MGQLFNKICLERLLLAIVVLLETHCYKTLIQLAPVEAQPQANLSKQPGNSCFKIQLEMERWADTFKTWLNQHPCHVCSYGWSTAVSRAVKLVRHLGGGTGGDGGTDGPQQNQKQHKHLKGRERNSSSCIAWRSQHFLKGKEQANWAADSTSGKPIGKL